MIRFSPIILTLLTITATISRPSIAAELSTQEAVHALAVILTEAGEATFNKFGKLPTPQILFGIGGTHAYGSCQSTSGSTQIPGSFYCQKTNTILLEYQQLEGLRRSFGDGAIVYALAHEYAHYIQAAMGMRRDTITMQELEADCIAGVILNSVARKLQFNDSDIREIISTARAVGGGTHGTPEGRAASVFIGLNYGDFGRCGIKSPYNSVTATPSPNKSVSTPVRKSESTNPSRKGNTAKPNNQSGQNTTSSARRFCTSDYSLGNSKGFNACYSLRKTFSNGNKFIAITLTHPKNDYLHRMVTLENRFRSSIILSCSQRLAHIAYEDGQLMKDTSPAPSPLSYLYNWHSIDDDSAIKNPFEHNNSTLRKFCSSQQG